MLPVLIAFAGVLIAAVATGMLAGRRVRGLRLCFAVWSVAALGLMVALAAASVGLATGFGPVTFRAVELGGQLIAPLWLAWGLVEFVAGSEAVRFGVRLIYGFALTVVIGLILATDTLSPVPFSKAWPSANQHYQPVSHYALLLAQVFAVAGALAAAGAAWARARNEREWAPAVPGVGALALAVLLTVALRFSLPTRSAYPLLATIAGGLVWFGVTRGLSTVDDSWRPAGRGDRSRRGFRSRRDDRDLPDQRDETRGPRRDGRGSEPQGYESGRYEQDPYRQDDYRQDEYRQDEYRQDEYGRDRYGRSQYSQDQRVPDPYGRGQHTPDPYGQGQNGYDSYGQGQYVPDPYAHGQQAHGQHARDPYPHGQHGQDQYAQDRYAPDPYSQEQYAQQQYGQEQYAQEQHAQDRYAPDPYGQEQYAQEQYAPDPYGQEHAPDPYGTDRYGQGSYPDQYGAGQSASDPYAQSQRGTERRGPDPYAPTAGYGGYERDAGGHDGRYEATGRGARSAAQPDQRATGGSGAAMSSGVPLGQTSAAMADAEFGTESPASRGGAQSRPYGRIQIFTLLDDKAADFDRLAEQTAEEVRIGEPDTLVYVIHLVPNAPMQRIFYEIYRDRTAFDSHENKSYTKRFVSERRSYVLATNVIELRLKYAKVAPLPVDSGQLETGRAARAQLPPGTGTGTGGGGGAPRHEATAPRYEATTARPAASAPRQPGPNGQHNGQAQPNGQQAQPNGQWAHPSADYRYGRV